MPFWEQKGAGGKIDDALKAKIDEGTAASAKVLGQLEELIVSGGTKWAGGTEQPSIADIQLFS